MKRILLLLVGIIAEAIQGMEFPTIVIQGIEPLGGPAYGETRVTVRIKDFDKSLIDDYPRPKVK